MRALRWRHKRSKTRPDDQRHAQTLGLRLGYWPCLRAPYVSVEVGSHRWDLWWGLPSYEG
jgi:hypothetical protein